MDVTGVLAVKLDPGLLQMKSDLNQAPAQAVLPQATKPAEPSDASHQSGYQRQQGQSRDTIELRKRNQEWEKLKILPSPPELEVKLVGAPEEEQIPAQPNARAIEVVRRYDEIAQHKSEIEKGLDLAA